MGVVSRFEIRDSRFEIRVSTASFLPHMGTHCGIWEERLSQLKQGFVFFSFILGLWDDDESSSFPNPNLDNFTRLDFDMS